MLKTFNTKIKNKNTHGIFSTLAISVMFLFAGLVFFTENNFFFNGMTPVAHAQTDVAELRRQIEENNKKRAEIEKEISQLSGLYDTTSKQAQTLQNALRQLEISGQKLAADLALTSNRIKTTSLTLEEVTSEIITTEVQVALSEKALAQSIRNMNESEGQSLVQALIGYQSISDASNYIHSLRSVQVRINAEVSKLKALNESLQAQKSKLEQERGNLITLEKDLSNQRQAVEYSKKEQDKLLAETRNNAALYQTQLNQKIKEREAWERELFEIESALKIIIDPTSIPGQRNGLLSWPLTSVFITQPFGATVDSKRLYVSGTHNGVDFRAAVGTPILSVLDGTVEAVGNTDFTSVKNNIQYQNYTARSCNSYGKWVLIKHPNGLSSLYAHLSVIGVNPGDIVKRGDRIGYSGNTGYSTGPHLHLTILASQGVKVQKYSTSINCKDVTIPFADVKAYLDPLAYLPAR